MGTIVGGVHIVLGTRVLGIQSSTLVLEVLREIVQSWVDYIRGSISDYIRVPIHMGYLNIGECPMILVPYIRVLLTIGAPNIQGDFNYKWLTHM